jgi:hypothetical protein
MNGRAQEVLDAEVRRLVLEETLAALSDRDLMQQIRQSETAAAKGDIVSLDDLRERLDSDPRST